MENKAKERAFLPNNPNRCAICSYFKKSHLNGNSKNGTCERIDYIYSKNDKNTKIDIQVPRWGLCDNFEINQTILNNGK